MDAEGFVTIVDRVKDMLISGGENVYPAEIENVILGHAKVADVGVIGIPSKKWGESPLAVIVRSDESLTSEEVIEHCRGKLAPFKAVKAVAIHGVVFCSPRLNLVAIAWRHRSSRPSFGGSRGFPSGHSEGHAWKRRVPR